MKPDRLFGQRGADSAHAEAASFEAARLDLIEQAERRAWKGAAAAAAGALTEALAIAAMMPLKTTEPFVVEVDRSTGASTILTVADEKAVPVSEIQDKYWLSQYVLARESYDYRTLENDFIRTRELSAPGVFEPYAAQFGNREDSLERRWGDAKQVRVTLTSVVPNGNGIGTVRFRRAQKSTATGAIEQEAGFTATVGYEYRPQYRSTEEKRLVNPFGFRVTSYRVDQEIGEGGAK